MTDCCAQKKSGLRPLVKILVVCLLIVGWFWWQQNGLVREVIEVKGCPAAFDGLRIVQVSDLHDQQFGVGNARLLRAVAKQKPDLIAITGDLIHDPTQLERVPAVAAGLAAIAPTYYVTGNHEWAAHCVPALKETLQQNGVTVLTNEFVLFKRDGQTLVLLGADDPNGPADQKSIQQLAEEAREKAGKGAYLLLLSHRNNIYPTYIAAQVDLTLAGHAHGGLIRLPGTDGLIGPRREWFPDHTAGLYQLEYGQMVVSRGLGNQLPAIRLFNRPDLPLVILRAAA